MIDGLMPTFALLARTGAVALFLIAALARAGDVAPTPNHDDVIAALRDPVDSTGNITDAVEDATGAHGWMSTDMKPIFESRIAGRAARALMRPVLRSDTRKYQNHLLEILNPADPDGILVYVMQNGLEIAAMGNLMATTAKVRGLEGAVIDGAVRDITEIRQIGFPVSARRVSPATWVGRMVNVDQQIPVLYWGILVNPGDYVVGDADRVVVVPRTAAGKVLEFLRLYADQESRMVPIIRKTGSMLKALERYNRY